MSSRVVLIDGNNLLAISTFAHKGLSTQSGTPTGGLFGSLTKIRTMLLNEFAFDVSRVVVVMDAGRPAFRKKLVPTYKQGRETKGGDAYQIAHAEYKAQRSAMPGLLKPFGVDVTHVKGWEADDVLAYMALRTHASDEVVVVSSDKDLVQLASPRVWVYNSQRGEYYKQPIPGYLLRRCLSGDSSDCIPGIGGIGPVRADEIVDTLPPRMRDPSGLAQCLDEGTIPDKYVEKIRSSLPAIRRNWRVMRLNSKKNFAEIHAVGLTEQRGKLSESEARKVCESLEFDSLLSMGSRLCRPFSFAERK